jgi:aminoglycoside/choline kinase family phosphotransferase
MTADASFRRFERLATDAGSRVLMDAPPATEDSDAFVRVCAWLERAGLDAPRVLAADTARGFLLVTDLGETTLARALAGADDGRRDALYRAALDTLVAFQRAALDDPPPVPAYDAERLALENGLFATWFLEGRLGRTPPAALAPALDALSAAHLAAPRVAVHLDYHSRNLIVGDGDRIGIVDVQDARIGPAPYDVVSLLRDCYGPLPAPALEAAAAHYLERAAAAGIPGTADAAAWRRDFDLVGLQRHLKAVGIFARLSLRDGRDHALGDIDRTLAMIADVGARHDATARLAAWVAAEARPANAALREAGR